MKGEATMEQKLKQIMANIFETEEDEITDESSMDSIEKWDSLKHINLIIAIEEQFGISIDEEEMIEMTCFAKIKHILRNNGVEI
jgi:acyl carrier protein